MINSLKNAFSITIQNSLLVLNFVLIFIFLQIFGAIVFLRTTISPSGTIVPIVLFFLLSVALFSGWLGTLKLAVDNNKIESEQTKQDNHKMFAAFFTEIGESFWVNLGIIIFYILIFLLCFFVCAKLLIHFNSELLLSRSDFVELNKKLLLSEAFSQKMLEGKMGILIFWFGVFNVIQWIYSYFVTYSLVAVSSRQSKNVFVNIKNSILFLVHNFTKSALLFAVLSVLYLLVSVVMLLLSQNMFLNILAIFLLGFYFTFYVASVFCFYEEKI